MLKSLVKMDGGFASRKLWFSVMTAVMIFAAGFIAAVWPAFLPALETVVGGLVAVLGLYTGGNVGAKWAIGKTVQGQAKETNTEEKPE